MTHSLQFAPGEQLAQPRLHRVTPLQSRGRLANGRARFKRHGHPRGAGKPGQRRPQGTCRNIEFGLSAGLRPRRLCHDCHAQRHDQRHTEQCGMHGAAQGSDGWLSRNVQLGIARGHAVSFRPLVAVNGGVYVRL
ncbi:hypothetical protein D3C87_1320720 [compost metagenome]